MDKHEIRRLNLLALVSARCGGKKSVLADKLGRSASYVSRMLAPEGNQSKKNIGEDMVEVIERVFELRKGALDEIETLQVPSPSLDLTILTGARRVSVGASARDIPIKKVALTLQAGIMGFEATQEVGDDSTIDIPLRFVEENNLVPHCLLAISIKGDSMWPLMIDGDIVVINIADTRPVNNELYAINFEGEAVVKRLVYEGREWYLTSMNPDPQYKRRICRGGECIIVGRVVFQPGRKLIGRV